MAHLTDMEELLAKIPRPDIADYMREAFSCYGAGAYRGCIVLSFIALADDLYLKLKELASVNAKAREIHSGAAKRRDEQEVFEKYLIDNVAAQGLMSALDASFARLLGDLRNKASHPSGHRPSAEEARFVFSEVITRFLANETLRTTHVVDGIVARLPNSNFFPGRTYAEVCTIVAAETKSLEPSAAAYLVAALVREYGTTPAQDSNIDGILIGLAALPQFDEAMVKLFRSKADDQVFARALVQVLSSKPRIVLSFDEITQARMAGWAKTHLLASPPLDMLRTLSHPVYLIHALLREVGEAPLGSFDEAIRLAVTTHLTVPMLVATLPGNPKAIAAYLDSLKRSAGSADYNIANPVSEYLHLVDSEVSAIASDQFAFELLLEVYDTAAWGTFKARDLVATKFAPLVQLREKAKMFAANDPASAAAAVATIVRKPPDLATLLAEIL